MFGICVLRNSAYCQILHQSFWLMQMDLCLHLDLSMGNYLTNSPFTLFPNVGSTHAVGLIIPIYIIINCWEIINMIVCKLSNFVLLIHCDAYINFGDMMAVLWPANVTYLALIGTSFVLHRGQCGGRLPEQFG